MSEQPRKAEEIFINRLIKTCTDRGFRAELRRYWSPATRYYAYPVLGHLGVLGKSNLPEAITAALYAIHPQHLNKSSSVGKACHDLAAKSGVDSFDRHFRRLLACDELDEVGACLQRVFKRMEREGIALDYVQLLWDLRKWRRKAEEVKTDWAKDFWQVPEEAQPSAK